MKYKIGNRIRYFRELRDLSQKELAAAMGVSNARISNWELGISRPDADMLVLLCRALEVSADELLDMSSPNMGLTQEEKNLITAYRNRPDLHQAIKILLDLHEKESAVPAYLSGEAAAYGGESAKVKTTEEKLKELYRMKGETEEQ